MHGSPPNTSPDRFRRALIGHYIRAAQHYHPALRMDGTALELTVRQGDGACREWTEDAEEPAIAMTGYEAVTRKHE